MRVAVAGTCGLALAIAREIEEETSHQVIILSRIVSYPAFVSLHTLLKHIVAMLAAPDKLQYQPNLTARGYQCQVVDYANAATLQHSLMGVDTVISTVSGTAQLRLIEAAVAARVRRFAPAEFEGQPSLRSSDDPLDASKALARAHLQYYQSYIESTVFVCGILYERFSVGGMKAHRIGVNSGYGNEGDYIVNARSMKAEAPIYDAANNLSFVCMTSAYDVARFVVRALDMAQWPSEMSMCGERMSVNALVEAIKAYRGEIMFLSFSGSSSR